MRMRLVILAILFNFPVLVMGGPAVAHHHPSCAALHEAAFLDEAEEVRGLLAHGVDVECLDVLGHTPLVTAVNGASAGAFQVLMEAGARVDVRTEYGQSLLDHTKEKYAAFTSKSGLAFRRLFGDMVARLETAQP